MADVSKIRFWLRGLPRDQDEALAWLLALLRHVDAGNLRDVTNQDFLRGWWSIGFLYPGLHPDGDLDEGETSNEIDDALGVMAIEPRLVVPFYVESGWPKALVPIAWESWRRYLSGQFLEGEFYCSEAVIAGVCFRCPETAAEVRAERERIREYPVGPNWELN